jgi:iron complex transport system substrate-binding protein
MNGIIVFVFASMLALGLSAVREASESSSNPGPTSGPSVLNTRTAYPLTIDSCGQKLTFNTAPSRAITLNQNVTEIMLALNLGDRMVGTAFLQKGVLPEHKAAYDKIPVLAERYPSIEQLMAADPDFVYAGLSGSLGDNPLATRQQLGDLGIPTFQATDYCATNPGVTPAPLTLEILYQDIDTVARIFDVQERGTQVVERLKGRVAEVSQSVSSVQRKTKVGRLSMFATNIATAGGRADVSHLIIEHAGGEDVFGEFRRQRICEQAVYECPT